MHQLILRALMLLVIAACAGPGGGFRDPRAPISSAAVFDPARFAGAWHEVAGVYDPARQSCALGLTHVNARPGGGLMLTLAGCAGPAATVAAPRTAAARFTPALTGPRGEPWWVLWVDQDYRTAVIGTPSGHFAAVLNRPGPIAADRLAAARTILDFNGYDVARLVATK